MRHLLISVGQRVKGDFLFNVHDQIPAGALGGLMARRVVMALHGRLLAARSGKPHYPVLVTRAVAVTNARFLTLSCGVTTGAV